MRPEIATSVLGGFHFHDKSSHFFDEYVRFQKPLNVSDAGIKKINQLFPLAVKCDSSPRIWHCLQNQEVDGV